MKVFSIWTYKAKESPQGWWSTLELDIVESHGHSEAWSQRQELLLEMEIAVMIQHLTEALDYRSKYIIWSRIFGEWGKSKDPEYLAE